MPEEKLKRHAIRCPRCGRWLCAMERLDLTNRHWLNCTKCKREWLFPDDWVTNIYLDDPNTRGKS